MAQDELPPRLGHRSRLSLPSLFAVLAALLAMALAFALVLGTLRPAPMPASPLDFPVPEPELSQAERAYLDRLGPLSFCVDSDWEPYEKIDETGAYHGIAADLVRLIAARSGVELALARTKDWSESLAYSKAGKCLILAFLNQSPERSEWLDFTEPYFTDPNVFITRSDHDFIVDPAALTGSVIVFPAGTSLEERVRARYPNLEVRIADSELDALSMVERGEADMTLRSLTMAAYVIRKEGRFNLRISGRLPELDNQFRMGVLKEEPLLRDILDRGVRSLTPQEVQAIVNSHIAIEARMGVDYRPLHWTLGAAGALLLAALAYEINLRRYMRHLRLVIDTVPAFIFAKDRSGRYLLANRWMATAFGRSPEEVVGLTDRECRATDEEIAAFLEQDRKVLQSGKPLRIDEHEGRRIDGSPGWFQTIKVPYRQPGTKSDAVLGVTIDITALKMAGLELEERERRFRHMAQHDGLTDLPNRALFSDRLGQAMALCRREGKRLALAFVDLDKFKEVNDSLGHAAGDELLKEAARRMRACVRSSDTVGRIGGDEFILFFLGVEDGPAAVSAAEKIRTSLERPFELGDRRGEVSASIGIALFPDDAFDETSLARRADAAMYRSKTQGRNRVSLYDPSLDENPEAGE